MFLHYSVQQLFPVLIALRDSKEDLYAFALAAANSCSECMQWQNQGLRIVFLDAP